MNFSFFHSWYFSPTPDNYKYTITIESFIKYPSPFFSSLSLSLILSVLFFFHQKVTQNLRSHLFIVLQIYIALHECSKIHCYNLRWVTTYSFIPSSSLSLKNFNLSAYQVSEIKQNHRWMNERNEENSTIQSVWNKNTMHSLFMLHDIIIHTGTTKFYALGDHCVKYWCNP